MASTSKPFKALIEKLAEFEPGLVDRVIASLPLTSLDPHRASVLAREKGLWRAVGAIAAALGGGGGAMRELSSYVSQSCGRREGSRCTCAGWALVVAAADALAGRGAAGRALPHHAQPSARHDALLALLNDEREGGGKSPLRIMVEHDAAAAIRLLEQSFRDPPFVGPLGKQNRLRVARALLTFAPDLPDLEDRVEILEFLTTQINLGAIPADQEVIIGLRALAAISDNERSDRAWITLLLKGRTVRDTLEEQYNIADQRPRVQWRIDVMLSRHDRALEDFLKINTPSSTDIDELFEYLRPLVESDETVKRQFEQHLPALIKFRPRAAARLAADYLPDSCISLLKAASTDDVIELGKSLLEVGRLNGEAAEAHLNNLCRGRPAEVRAFLAENSGLVRPEVALATVHTGGPLDAEPLCLEAVGDPSGALDAILHLAAAAKDEQAVTAWFTAGAELCARTTLPRSIVADMWTRLLRQVRSPPPTLVLEAAAYVPITELVEGACETPGVALALLACAASRRRSWYCATRVTSREAHENLARALTTARRALVVRGRCVHCGRRLADCPPVRTTHCGRAVHFDCEAETTCGICGRRTPTESITLPQRSVRRPSTPPQDFELLLVAPPRPDLEGVV